MHCRTGCTALQDGLHCTAGRVAVHCVENHSFSPSLTDYVMSSEMRVSSRVHAYVDRECIIARLLTENHFVSARNANKC